MKRMLGMKGLRYKLCWSGKEMELVAWESW